MLPTVIAGGLEAEEGEIEARTERKTERLKFLF